MCFHCLLWQNSPGGVGMFWSNILQLALHGEYTLLKNITAKQGQCFLTGQHGCGSEPAVVAAASQSARWLPEESAATWRPKICCMAPRVISESTT